MSTRTVTILGEKISIKVFEEHKTVWNAIGVYKGEGIEVSGRNISEAVKLWCNAATYRGNLGSGSSSKTKRARIS